VYDPAVGAPVSDTVSVEIAVPPDDNETAVGLRVAENPAGEFADKATLPENVLRLLTVMVEVPAVPWATFIDVGFADMLKSAKFTEIVIEWRRFEPALTRPFTDQL
jgi:hypothetical protein